MSTNYACDNCGERLAGPGTWGQTFIWTPYRFHVTASSETRDKADLCDDCTLALLTEAVIQEKAWRKRDKEVAKP